MTDTPRFANRSELLGIIVLAVFMPIFKLSTMGGH